MNARHGMYADGRFALDLCRPRASLVRGDCTSPCTPNTRTLAEWNRVSPWMSPQSVLWLADVNAAGGRSARGTGTQDPAASRRRMMPDESLLVGLAAVRE